MKPKQNTALDYEDLADQFLQLSSNEEGYIDATSVVVLNRLTELLKLVAKADSGEVQ